MQTSRDVLVKWRRGSTRNVCHIPEDTRAVSYPLCSLQRPLLTEVTSVIPVLSRKFEKINLIVNASLYLNVFKTPSSSELYQYSLVYTIRVFL